MINLTKEETSLSEALCFPAKEASHMIITARIVISVFNILFSITAALGNILIFIAFSKESSLHPPSKLLFRCLAVTDLGVGVLTQPMFVIYQLSVVAKRFDVCSVVATVSYVTSTLLCSVSLATFTAVSVDRLLALQLKMRYRHVVTLSRVRMVVVFIWLQSFAVSMLVFGNTVVYFGLSCTTTLLSVAASAFCYLKIYCTLQLQRTQVQDSEIQLQAKTNGTVLTGPQSGTGYKKTVSSALVFHLVLILCYLPYAVVRITVAVIGRRFLVSEGVAASVVYLNSTLNPLFYCWKIKEIRHEVKQIIRKILSSQN